MKVTAATRMAQMERDLGDIKGAIGELKGSVSAIKEQQLQLRLERSEDALALREELGGIHQTLQAVQAAVSETKGSWRALAAVAGLAGTVGGLAVTILRWLKP